MRDISGVERNYGKLYHRVRLVRLSRITPSTLTFLTRPVSNCTQDREIRNQKEGSSSERESESFRERQRESFCVSGT